jgi:exopolysaccharide biosynthesis protein
MSEHVLNKNNSAGRLIGRIVARFFIFLLVIIAALLIFIFGCITIICKGPSPSARDLFVVTVTETSALKFIPKIYYSDSEIKEIINKNKAVETLEVTDQSLIHIPDKVQLEKSEEKPLEIVDISGSTYKGKLMIVRDPSRVVLGTLDSFGSSSEGIQISEMVEKENGIAGINGGGFADKNGVGNGGQPLGIVIKNGELLYNGGSSVVVGFDKDNKLVVGYMSGEEAIQKNIRDACSFGPVLIVNGKRSETVGTGSGINPRTCIGQTADGTVLMLVIDGRQATSLGATFDDCIDILEEYGAVNAANLDGGSSSVMYYNGEVINVCASVYGPRQLPTGFVVLKENSDN